MVRMILISMALVMVANLSGCGVVKQSQSRSTNEKIMQLQVGMNRQQVLSLMGNPYRREVYGDSEFLIYETNHWAESASERFTPIHVKDGKVMGWGRNYYDNAVRSKVEADIQIKQ